MSELTEANLEAMLIKIRNEIDNTGNKSTLRPTHFIFRPADLVELGLTVDEITKMIKEQKFMIKEPEDEAFEEIEKAQGWRKRQIEEAKEKRCPLCNHLLEDKNEPND